MLISPNSNGICSSGSTGTPKVILSQQPAVFNPMMGTPIAEAFMPVTRPQRILVLAPMYHINAFATLSSMLTGDQLFVLEKFDAARIVDVIERHRITTFTATPTMLQRIADLPGVDDRDLSSIEWIMQGAAPMPPSLVHRWADLIGAEKIIMAYGSTEALGLTVLTGLEWLEHEGSVGRGFNGAEVRILDDDGNDVATGEIGHIFVRSPNYVRRDLPRRGAAAADDRRRLRHRRRHGLPRRRRLPLPRRPARRPHHHRRRQRVPGRGRGGADRPPEDRRRRRGRAQGRGVGSAGARHHRTRPIPPTRRPSTRSRRTRRAGSLPYKVPKSIEIVDAIPRSEAMKVNRAARELRRVDGSSAGDGVMDDGAFDGIRVVELAQWVFVPVAGALLADWGADVVRIDRPEGDPYRGLVTQGIGTDSGGVNLSIALANRGQALDGARPPHRRRQGDAASPARVGRRASSRASGPTRCATLGLDADDVARALPAARLRPRPRLRGARPRRRSARLRRVGVLGPRRHGPRAHAAPTATTRSPSAARSATATAAWRWRSGSRPRC